MSFDLDTVVRIVIFLVIFAAPSIIDWYRKKKMEEQAPRQVPPEEVDAVLSELPRRTPPPARSEPVKTAPAKTAPIKTAEQTIQEELLAKIRRHEEAQAKKRRAMELAKIKQRELARMPPPPPPKPTAEEGSRVLVKKPAAHANPKRAEVQGQPVLRPNLRQMLVWREILGPPKSRRLAGRF